MSSASGHPKILLVRLIGDGDLVAGQHALDVALQHVKIAIPEIQIGKRILPKAYHKTEGAFVTEFLAKGPDLVACLDGLLKSYGGGDWDVRHSDDGIGCHAVWNREDQPLLDIDYLTWAFVELIHEESLSSGWE